MAEIIFSLGLLCAFTLPDTHPPMRPLIAEAKKLPYGSSIVVWSTEEKSLA